MALERLRKEMEELEIKEVSRSNFLVYKREGDVINNEINDDRFSGKKLKNYKSPDLQIVIFLQLVEIERLTLENQKLQEKDFSTAYLVNCMELDRVSREYEKLRETHENEMVRTREMETKLFEFEGKYALLTQEVERLKMMLETRSKETKTFKDELDSANAKLKFYSNAESELETLRREIERLKMVIKSKDNEVGKWNRDYTELNGNYKAQEDKIILLSGEIHRLNNIKGSLESELKEKTRSFESQIQSLNEEIERLNRLLETRDNEIEEWRVKFTRLELSLKDYRVLQKKYKEQESVIAEYDRKFEEYEKEMEDYLKLKKSLQEAEHKITKQREEIENFAQEIARRDLRIVELEKIISEWERKLQPSFDRIKELEQKLSKLQKEHDVCASIRKKYKDLEAREKSLIEQLAAKQREVEFRVTEIEKWKYEYSVLEVRVQELQVCEEKLYEAEDHKAIMEQEIERLNSEVRSRNESITVLKIEISRLQLAVKEFKGLYKEYQDAEEKISTLSKLNSDYSSDFKARETELLKSKEKFVRINNKFKEDLADVRKKLNSANQTVESLKGMNEGLSGDLEDKGKEFLKLKRKNERMKVLLDKFREMEGKFIDSEIFIKEFRPLLVKYFQLEADHKEQITLISEYQSSVSMMKQEIIRLKSLTKSLEEELTQSKSGHAICELRFRDYEERLSCLGQEIERLQFSSRMKPTGIDRDELENMSFQLKKMSTVSLEKEEKIARLNETIDKLKIQLSEKDSKISTIEHGKSSSNYFSSTSDSKISTMETEISRLKEKESALMEKISLISQENLNLKHRIDNSSTSNSSSQQLQSEISSLRGELQQRDSRISSLQAQVRQMETIISEKTSQVNSLQSEKISLNTRLREVESSSMRMQESSTSSVEIRELRTQIAAKDRRIRELEDTSELEMKIGFMSTEIERLRHVNQDLERRLA